MKKISLVLALLLIFSLLASCNEGDTPPEVTTTAATTTTTVGQTSKTEPTSDTSLRLYVAYELNMEDHYDLSGNEADKAINKLNSILAKLEWKDRAWKMNAEYSFYSNNPELNGIEYSTSYSIINIPSGTMPKHAEISGEVKQEIDALIVEITGKPVGIIYENATMTS